MADGSDVLTGGTIEPRFLEEEMRSSYLDYAMSVIVGRALPDVRDGLKPCTVACCTRCTSAATSRTAATRSARRITGDVMGDFHPHGDSSIYDTLVRMAQDFAMRYPLVDGQGNFGSMDNDPPAAMRYTEARLQKIATEMLRDIDADTVDFGPELRRDEPRAAGPPGALPEPAGERLGGHRGRHGDEHPAAQPARVDRRGHRLHGRPDDRHRGPDEAHQGPGLPDGRHDRRPLRHQGRVRDGPRPRARARARAHRAAAPGQGGDHRHRDALPGVEGRRPRRRLGADQEDRRGRQRQEDHGDLGHPRRVVGQGRRPDRDRAEARRHPEGRAQQALQAHADADHVRRQRRGARRRRAAHAAAHRHHRRVRAPPARRRRAADEARAASRRGARAHPRGPPDRARPPRRGDRPHPRLARPGDGAQRPHGAVRAHAAPGAGHPRPHPAAPHRARGGQDPPGARRPRRADPRAARDPRRRVARRRHHQGGAARGPRDLRRRPPHGDHALRGRDRHRGPDRRPADGHRDHEHRLHQVAAARDLPPAEARRRGRRPGWT